MNKKGIRKDPSKSAVSNMKILYYKRIGKYVFENIPRFPDDTPLSQIFDKAMSSTTGQAHIGLIMALCKHVEGLEARVDQLEAHSPSVIKKEKGDG